jgi:hypothetical protein
MDWKPPSGFEIPAGSRVADKKSAMLYSLSAMTTFGHSGSTLELHWQLMGALEALNGLILFGPSRAFLYGILQQAWIGLGFKGIDKVVV